MGEGLGARTATDGIKGQQFWPKQISQLSSSMFNVADDNLDLGSYTLKVYSRCCCFTHLLSLVNKYFLSI